VATKKRNGAKAKVAEATAEYRTQALGEVFWLAFQQLSEDDQRAFMTKLLEDPEWYEDIYDAIMSIKARKEPARPYREVAAELRRDGLL
jgi:hypothetical protein